MKRVNKENKFLVIWLICFILLLGSCNLGFFKGTWSAFGNITGQLTLPYTMNYYSNYPAEVGLTEEQRTENVTGKTYTIMENVFNASGYEFVSWNNTADGTGETYNSGDSISLDKSMDFYAQWKKIESIFISYGDATIDGVINEEDYLLIERYISMESELIGQGLLNSDVNLDGKVDLVDVDIIKQVCLGTDGYIGFLPDNPILVYEIYDDEKIEDTDEEDKTEDNNDDNSSSGSSENGSTSGGSSSSGSSSSGGSSSGGNSGGGTGSRPNSGNGNKPSSGANSGSNNNLEDDVTDKNEVLEENNSDTILDEDNTNKDNEYDNNESNNIEDKKSDSIYPVIIVVGICLLAFRLIIYVIKKFNEKEKKDFDKEVF